LKEGKNMSKKWMVIAVLCAGVFSIAGCVQELLIDGAELRDFPIDSMQGIITRTGVMIDEKISSDGRGSLRITATGPAVVRLFEVRNIDVENARLVYQAKLRTKDVKGSVYLEMWCHLPGKGEFFSRGLQSPLTGTTDWTQEEIPFFLKKGETPDYVKLNLVVDGTGTIWIDDIHLLKKFLK